MRTILGNIFRIRKSIGIILLMLLIGYYGSITLFPHSHRINGISIVHSHPYKSGSGTESQSPLHSTKELQIIQLLTFLFTSVIFLSHVTPLIRIVVYEIPVLTSDTGYAQTSGSFNYSLRAPPARAIILNKPESTFCEL